MARLSGGPSRAGRVIAVIAVIALAALVVVLCVLALQRTAVVERAQRDETPAPITTPVGGDETPSPAPVKTSPTATPSADPSTSLPEPVAASAERYLSIGSGGMWRATAGECEGDSPTVEKSTDGGSTWVDVTPTYKGIQQVRGIETFAQTEAELLADMGDDCETQLLRTFTQGRFWDSYPEILAYWTYPSSADATVIVTPDGEVDAPCDDPRSVRASNGAVALVCDGTAYVLSDGEWDPLKASDAVALAISDGIVVAHTDESCPEGLAVTRFADGGDPASLGCVEGADAARPTAIAASGDTVLVWSGKKLLSPAA
ncbi:hypothetical protein [Microbacterium terricola]|uniref:Serine/threonine protein kinase n=1 Tax=Microbacterium terricola TaxID=344163 RepID=A0ABM8DWB0_9MICO|nr:hypothetical protein [Microbacterium terricola]UYK39485.1 hypothetical protein OAU46_12360 [Microbacterium terricola]BDV29786.1 hypothetical protein Microterr_04460 [Microbacterium terricola]